MNGNTKLWTGKTVRQELVLRIKVTAAAKDWPVNSSLEAALDGADSAAVGSILRETLRYWESLSGDAQSKLLGRIRAELRSEDRLVGRTVAR